MRWHDWLGIGLVTCGVSLCGCVHNQPVSGYANGYTLRDKPVEDDRYGVNVARAQQPESAIGPKTTTSLKDAPPPNVGELSISGIPAASIRATVNNEAILDQEVKAACYPMLRRLDALPEPERSQRQQEVFKEALDQIIEREVVLQVAFERLRKNGGDKAVDKLKEVANTEFERQWIKPLMDGNKIKSETDFKAALRDMNVSLEMMKRQWTRNFMAMEFMRQLAFAKIDNIGQPQIEEYYKKHPDEFQVPDSVVWEDIFVAEGLHPPRAAARQRAEAVLARMRQGEKVEKFLEEKLDDGLGSTRNGRGAGGKRGEIQPVEIEGPLFQLKDGAATIVEIGSGFHVIRVVKREYAGLLDFTPKTQKLIKEKLKNQMGQREMKKLVTQLRREALVEYAKN